MFKPLIEYDKKIAEYILNSRAMKKFSDGTMKVAEFSDKHFWRHVIKNEGASKVSIYGVYGLQAAAILGVMPYGLFTQNPDMVYNGFYAHIGLDVAMVTLSPSWGRYKTPQ